MAGKKKTKPEELNEELMDEIEEDLKQAPEVDIEFEDVTEEKVEKKPAKKAKKPETKTDKKPAKKAKPTKGMPKELVSGDAIDKASKKEKKEIYKKESVFTINAEDRIETESDYRKTTWRELLRSLNTGAVLEGTLMSCVQTGNGFVLGVVTYRDATVYIPAPFLFEFDPAAERTDSPTRAQVYYTNLRLGMEVKFVVKKAEEFNKENPEGGPVAYASRLDAISTVAKDYYVDTMSTGKSKIMEGALVRGKVTYLTRAGLGMEIQGADTFIPVTELTWKNVNDVRQEEYYVGQELTVKILSIEKVKHQANDRTFNLIHVEASVKQATANPADKFYKDFRIDQICLAEVTRIVDEGVFVFLAGKRDAFCKAPRNFETPPIGSLVQVKITRMEDDTKRIYAEMRSVIRMGK